MIIAFVLSSSKLALSDWKEKWETPTVVEFVTDFGLYVVRDFLTRVHLALLIGAGLCRVKSGNGLFREVFPHHFISNEMSQQVRITTLRFPDCPFKQKENATGVTLPHETAKELEPGILFLQVYQDPFSSLLHQ
jgi:hypothetical protein